MKRLIDSLVNWLGVPKNTEEYRWSQTPIYLKRVEQVKDAWIGSGIVMLAVAQPAFIIGFGLFVIFLSFAYLER
ncbi:MAG: hypothetical protein ACJA1U_002299 [Bermanella sp.]|jgi:hypothetical protein